ncbi:alpha-N-acetylgalactosaminide alpha-2,6-sialyltransferase 2-like [Branchiostoma floridae]|uniref:Alpha-N-acetylgalactosaminide alpha-2,6-sialyltransferase 2-like n=1 Tax=Branchiostoma floridae TaxID=7739 RepID=A0A9J7HT02_BRAFL|nr:alpha-N-acetylgalactosaminide alpha-2,6-sialyltransferase 2-like [Branchiostoma floridae]
MASEIAVRPPQDHQDTPFFRFKRRRLLKIFVAVLIACTVIHLFLYTSPRLKIATKAMSPVSLNNFRKNTTRLDVTTKTISPASLNILPKNDTRLEITTKAMPHERPYLLIKNTSRVEATTKAPAPVYLLRKNTTRLEITTKAQRYNLIRNTTAQPRVTTGPTSTPQTVVSNWTYNAGEMKKIRVDTRMLHPDVRLLPRKLGIWPGTCERKVGNSCQFLKHSVGFHKTCAVVGNGGILLDSHCGAEIDSKDYIIRMDLPAIRGFETDVGRKTNMTILNVSTPKRVAISSHLKDRTRDVYESRLRDINGSVLVAGDSLEMNNLKKAIQNYEKYKIPFSFVLLTSHGSFKLGKLIRRTAAKVRGNAVTSSAPSTGLGTVLTATAFCDQIYMYGFFPFKKDTHRRPIPYHYYPGDSIEPIFLDPRHRMDKEFNFFKSLHERGVVKLQVDKCES